MIRRLLIRHFPGYAIGEDGVAWTNKSGEWKPLKSMNQGRKYYAVDLFVGGKKYRRCVHLLVLEHFIGPRPPGTQGCHKDDDKENNKLSNLYWGTVLQNLEDQKRNGRKAMGSKKGAAKITEDDIPDIRTLLAQGHGQSAVARKYGVHPSVVNRINSGQAWAHVPHN